MKTGIFYGSTTGTTEKVAKQIGAAMGVADKDIINVKKGSPVDVADYDLIILGCSTWGAGDMQNDMHDFLDGVQSLDLEGKKVAFFGCGDEKMKKTFCNAVGYMYDMMKDTKAKRIGSYPAEVYNFTHTEAERDGSIVGLLIDDTNHADLTEPRIKQWVAVLREEE
ncbi:MAG: flavodoxin [Muribaculaceae bacterium]|nr:flavodoxin [Muribaculaceae bacterium]